MSKSIALKGEAAGAFIEAMTGREPKNEDAKYLRVASFVQAHMMTGDSRGATAILKVLAKDGIDTVVDLLTSKSDEDKKLGEEAKKIGKKKVVLTVE